MRSKLLMFAIATCVILLGCSKTEQGTDKNKTTLLGPVSDIAGSTGLKVSAVAGDYGNYQIIGSAANKSTGITGFSVANGGTAEMIDYNGSRHQKWRITYVGNNSFTIMNMGSGKVLESYNYNGSQVLIQNKAIAGNNSQLWILSPLEGKKYKAINKASNLAITSNGAAVIKLESYTGKPSQIWGYNELPADSYRDDEVTSFFQRKKGTVAWDGNHSLKLTYASNNGKIMWLTNDEFYNQLDANGNLKCYGTTFQFFHKNNAAMLQPASQSWDPELTTNYFVTSNGKQYDEEVFHDFFGRVLWPTGMVEIGSKIYVTTVQVNGLNILDQKLGIIDQADNTSTVITVPGFSGQSGSNRIEYSVGMFKDGDHVYIYGKDSGNNIYVARFATSAPTVWTFWDGTIWAASPAKTAAARLLRGVPSGGISVNKVKGKYVVVSHDFGFFCNGGINFYSWTSAAPNAPFGNKQTIYQRVEYKNGQLPVFYTPIIHPQFDNGKNELLITYCVNYYGDCDKLCQGGISGESPDGYRPKAFRVPYSLIGL